MLTINQAYKDQRVTTATGISPLSAHTDEDLLRLAIMARTSNNPMLLRCFTNLPQLDELKSELTAIKRSELMGGTATTLPVATVAPTPITPSPAVPTPESEADAVEVPQSDDEHDLLNSID